jgi:hypothetical protein
MREKSSLRKECASAFGPQNTFVEYDASLTVAIGKLRASLEDSADNPTLIETIPRKGYRFLAPVRRRMRDGLENWGTVWGTIVPEQYDCDPNARPTSRGKLLIPSNRA